MTDSEQRAAYVLAAELRLGASAGALRVEPETVEVTIHRRADPPAEDGWLWFRDHCWRGELNHPDHVADLLADRLGVAVDSIAFRELRTTQAYLDDLRAAIAADLVAFNADGVDEVLHKYLGSSIHVVDSGDL